MQPKKRYILVILSCAFLAYCYFGGYRLGSNEIVQFENPLASYIDLKLIRSGSALKRKATAVRTDSSIDFHSTSSCRMETCFDFSRCKKDFRIYIYPPDELLTVSHSYQKLLNVVEESKYYTNDPSQACLFLLSLDTLDRDHLSPDYVRTLQNKIQRLPYWNNGLNHVIFNLYSGTWPDYSENSLDFDAGMAILAKASVSINNLRPGFDISIPLFHKNHPEKGGESGFVSNNNIPLNKNYLLAFKGKRYVYGIGSETRNALFHLHNDRDVIMVATCRHGKNWKEMKDDRCDEDNKEYDRFDYEILLQNSTFCLVPRGRRLGSYRFLEALQAGCIPVILSNGWALPFSQIINWNKAVIWADERLLLQVPNTVRSISITRMLQLRQQTQILWERYFSSVDKIVYTTLEMIRERLPTSTLPRDGMIWNSLPGGLLTLPNFSDSPFEFPFLHAKSITPSKSSVVNFPPGYAANRAALQFTAVIYCQMGNPVLPSSTLYRLISNIAKSAYAIKILIIWSSDKQAPDQSRWPSLPNHISLHVIHSSDSSLKPSISQRFYPYRLIETQAVLSLDEDIVLTTDEMDFAFKIWQQFPERIVGYPARSHYWDDAKNSWGYTSKWTNDYSIVLTGAAFYHRYYNFLYTEWLNPLLHKTVEQSQNCEDILMNFLVSHVTRRPPIKVTQRKQYKDQLLMPSITTFTGSKTPSPPSSILLMSSSSLASSQSPWNDPDHFLQRQTCLNTFAAVFGYMPLLRSNLRLDPVLFKDPVSNLRKKYRKIELVGS